MDFGRKFEFNSKGLAAVTVCCSLGQIHFSLQNFVVTLRKILFVGFTIIDSPGIRFFVEAFLDKTQRTTSL